MEISTHHPGSFGSNCYILRSGNEAAVVDPSLPMRELEVLLTDCGATLRYVLLTHGHFDHIFSLDELAPKARDGVRIHETDADKLSDAHKNGFYYFFHNERTWMAPVKVLQEGDILPLGDEVITVLHTPGHTSGSVCYLCGDKLITGDTLFANNVGRCDLPSGDEAELIRSLDRLRTLPHDLTIYPGHGPEARLGDALSAIDLFGF